MIQIGLDFIRAYSPSEQLVMLYLLLHADKNGNVDFCERNISRVTEVSYKTCRTIHQRLKIEGVIKGAPKGALQGAVGEVVTICDFESYSVLTKIRAHIGGAPQGALNEVETTKEKENVFPQTPLQREIENNKDEEDNIITPYKNPPAGDCESSFFSRFAEMEKALAELSDENKKLQDENNELRERKAKRDAQDKFDVRADLSYVDDQYAEKWNEWLSYKDKIGKQYKTQDGASKQYRQWLNTAEGSYAKACAIIDQSIRQSWTGLFDIKDWVEPEEKRDPTIPNKDKYEPDLPYSEIMGAFLVPNKYPDWNEDWPYTPDTRPDGARICNGSNGWRWDAANKRWIEMMWIMDKRQWFDR